MHTPHPSSVAWCWEPGVLWPWAPLAHLAMQEGRTGVEKALYLEVLDLAVADVEPCGGWRDPWWHPSESVALHWVWGLTAASSRIVGPEPRDQREQNEEGIEQLHLPEKGLTATGSMEVPPCSLCHRSDNRTLCVLCHCEKTEKENILNSPGLKC